MFTVQNKTLPGAYINFVSAARATATLSDRGTAALPLPLDWGPEGEVFTVTNGEFQKDSLKLFGHAYTDEALRPLRELFAKAQTAHLFRLDCGGTRACCALARAKHPGTAGNGLTVVVGQSEAFEAEKNEVYDVSTYMNGALADRQKGVKSAAELADNAFLSWIDDATLAVTAGEALTGGTNGEVSAAAYQTFLDKIEPYSFNTLGCVSTDDTVKSLFVSFTKRMRDEQGVKFQTVLHRFAKADYEGVISVENGLSGADEDPSLVYWLTGAQAACAVNRSLTNEVYIGEYAPNTAYTQAELTQAIETGKLLLHRVGDEVRVLTDINTFVSATDEKSADFSSNQTVRVLDQIGNDIAGLFNRKYLGRVPNDNAGRISLWSDIVSHHNQLQTIRAIENFSSEDVTVTQGDTKKSVVVSDHITPVNAMEQLYMVVVVQ